ncbi:MAG: DUF2779 domain-containing protein [Bacilli bacterium]
MAISKTDFINYTRCSRYYHLEDIRKDKLSSLLTREEYLKELDDEMSRDIACEIFSESDEDLTEKVNIQLNALKDYYTQVELIAGEAVHNLFGGSTTYGNSIDKQMCYDFDLNGIRYMCYADIVNETDNEINVVEVKATTSSKYLGVVCGKEKEALFSLVNGIYELNHNIDDDDFNKGISKFYNKYSLGKYPYDLAVQRYFIEGEYKNYNNSKKFNYYLAILNHEYVYDGYTEAGKRVYRADANGNNIISIFNMNEITSYLVKMVDNDRKVLEDNIFHGSNKFCKVSEACALKKNNECKFKDICYKNVPRTNASYNYKRFLSFKDENGCKYDKYDLINDGYLKFDDVPIAWLVSKNHIIQREAYDNKKEYINKKKIKSGIESLKYPIYHLDFETFPCPLPRFRGEKCYTQSPFEFSLHIEKAPGVCDKDKDNYVFMAKTLNDEREEMVKLLVKYIPIDKGGVMLAQNVSFEKARIKELAVIFPKYKEQLMNIYDNSFDLLYLLDTNKVMYEALGFSSEEAGTLNYYNFLQSGSYSIKKTLPLFSDLSYSTLEIKNGTEALVEYSKFDMMTHDEVENSRKNLITYCKQDTWAMVEILNGLRNLVK